MCACATAPLLTGRDSFAESLETKQQEAVSDSDFGLSDLAYRTVEEPKRFLRASVLSVVRFRNLPSKH